MKYTVKHQPSNAIVSVKLNKGEQVEAKPGAMIHRSKHIDSDVQTTGEGATGLIKSAISSEKDLTKVVHTAQKDGAEIVFGPELPGDLKVLNLDEVGPVKVQSTGAIAWTPGVERESALNEVGNLFSGNELTVLSLTGSGGAVISAFGAVEEIDVSPKDPVVVDEDYLIAWTDGLELSRQSDSGLKTSLMGGEGRVTRLEGNGKVWVQTRDPMVIRRNNNNNQ